ncbi:hypothetical protein RFI_05663 [Reticulomyxa filosa]|uniref:Uncharacterized protein n=1 Tax=Reticulomyxa filosa TaxID=46433 RepID=X6NZR7_RETFI|nr:hypothetical protein RFI_05663 [Reticulomyxa filosa]|eukprot:ETO31456.1 hypothetical protein RFI_05663 [Reticulomyxa filosa]
MLCVEIDINRDPKNQADHIHNASIFLKTLVDFLNAESTYINSADLGTGKMDALLQAIIILEKLLYSHIPGKFKTYFFKIFGNTQFINFIFCCQHFLNLSKIHKDVLFVCKFKENLTENGTNRENESHPLFPQQVPEKTLPLDNAFDTNQPAVVTTAKLVAYFNLNEQVPLSKDLSTNSQNQAGDDDDQNQRELDQTLSQKKEKKSKPKKKSFHEQLPNSSKTNLNKIEKKQNFSTQKKLKNQNLSFLRKNFQSTPKKEPKTREQALIQLLTKKQNEKTCTDLKWLLKMESVIEQGVLLRTVNQNFDEESTLQKVYQETQKLEKKILQSCYQEYKEKLKQLQEDLNNKTQGIQNLYKKKQKSKCFSFLQTSFRDQYDILEQELEMRRKINKMEILHEKKELRSIKKAIQENRNNQLEKLSEIIRDVNTGPQQNQTKFKKAVQQILSQRGLGTIQK